MSKYQTTVKSTKEDEEGKYEQVQFKSTRSLSGTVVEDAAGVMEEMQAATDKQSVKKALSRTYSFTADTLFEGQFAGEDYCKGIDAREIASLTGKLLKSVTAGFDETYTETKKKQVKRPSYLHLSVRLLTEN